MGGDKIRYTPRQGGRNDRFNIYVECDLTQAAFKGSRVIISDEDQVINLVKSDQPQLLRFTYHPENGCRIRHSVEDDGFMFRNVSDELVDLVIKIIDPIGCLYN